MLCIVQLGRSINIQRLAFATISNLINGESSIQLRVDELVSSLGLTIFTIIWNSANGGSSIQLLVDELARSLRLSPLHMHVVVAALVSKPLRPMAPGTRAADESFITLTLELNDFHQSKPLQYFYLRPATLRRCPSSFPMLSTFSMLMELVTSNSMTSIELVANLMWHH